MKVLFLDIDGVVNNVHTRERYADTYMLGIDTELAKIVKDIIAKTSCKVVLSSSWRQGAPLREWVRGNVCEFIDVTPDFQRGARAGLVPRNLEIQSWLSSHKVKRFAILDDFAEAEIPWCKEAFFKTDWQTGLTPYIAERVIEYLNKGGNDAKNEGEANTTNDESSS